MTNVLIKRENRAGKTETKDRPGGWSSARTSQGMPGATRRGMEVFPHRFLREPSPAHILTIASRTENQTVVASPPSLQLFGIC